MNCAHCIWIDHTSIRIYGCHCMIRKYLQTLYQYQVFDFNWPSITELLFIYLIMVSQASSQLAGWCFSSFGIPPKCQRRLSPVSTDRSLLKCMTWSTKSANAKPRYQIFVSIQSPAARDRNLMAQIILLYHTSNIKDTPRTKNWHNQSTANRTPFKPSAAQ